MRPPVLDVSNNRPITSAQLRDSQAVALIAKCTEGTSFIDATYIPHRTIASVVEVPFGAYHFLHADSPGDEAQYFLHHATPRPGDLQPIVDAERGLPAPEAHRCYSCLSEIDAAGFRPLGYASWSYLRAMLKAEPRLARFRWWEAVYGPVRLPVGMGASVVLWQFSQTYRVGGQQYDASRLLVPLDSLRIT